MHWVGIIYHFFITFRSATKIEIKRVGGAFSLSADQSWRLHRYNNLVCKVSGTMPCAISHIPRMYGTRRTENNIDNIKKMHQTTDKYRCYITRSLYARSQYEKNLFYSLSKVSRIAAFHLTSVTLHY